MKRILIAFLLFITTAPSWAYKVTGTVVAADNDDPVSFAGIKFTGANSNTGVADLAGNFSVDMGEGHDGIEITAVGYKTKTLTTNENTPNLGTIRLEPENIELNEAIATATSGCQSPKRQAELHAKKTKAIENNKGKLVCIPDECESDEYLLEKKETIDAKCTKCTSLIAKSNTAHVVNGLCVATSCKPGYTGDKCYVDCNTETELKKLNATKATLKSNNKTCYATACIEPIYTPVGSGESMVCQNKHDKPCDNTYISSIKNATSGTYDTKSNPGKLLCKPKCKDGFNEQINKDKTAYECVMINRTDKNCTYDEIAALKTTNTQYEHATHGTVLSQNPDTAAVTACKITGCDNGWEPSKQPNENKCIETKCECGHRWNRDKQACESVIGIEQCRASNIKQNAAHIACDENNNEYCKIDDNGCINKSFILSADKKTCEDQKNQPCKPTDENATLAGATYTYDTKTDQLICKPQSCKESNYKVTPVNGDYKCVRNDAACTTEELKKYVTDKNATAGDVIKGLSGEITGCKITDCISGYRPDKDGKTCKSTKCPCGTEWNDDPNVRDCTKWDGKCKEKPSDPNAKEYEMACNPENDPNGTPYCKITKCKDDTFKVVNNTTCQSKHDDLCPVNDIENAKQNSGKYDTESIRGVLLCKPECDGDNYEPRLDKKQQKYSCALKSDRTNTPCTPDEIKSLNMDSHTATATVKEWNKATGQVSQCAIETCQSGWNKKSDTECVECGCGERWDDSAHNCKSIIGTSCTAENAKSAKLACEGNQEICKIDMDGCNDGFHLNNNVCVNNSELKKLTDGQYQKMKDKLDSNVTAMKEKETSMTSKIIDAAGMGVTGIGGAMLAAGISEQRSDAAAEKKMLNYLATFNCDYGSGRYRVENGKIGATLPPSPDSFFALRQEYDTVARRLHNYKETLGIAPGIESQGPIDDTGALYDNAGTTRASTGTFSLARALTDSDSADAAEYNKQKKAATNLVTAGAITAGVGAVGSLTANLIANRNSAKENSKETWNEIEKLKDVNYQDALAKIGKSANTETVNNPNEPSSGNKSIQPTPTPEQKSTVESVDTPTAVASATAGAAIQ